jgi:hypothetical protein
MEEEELSLEDPPIPVRFASTGGEGGTGEVAEQPFDPQEVLPYPLQHQRQQSMIGGEASMIGGEASMIGGGGFHTQKCQIYSHCVILLMKFVHWRYKLKMT